MALSKWMRRKVRAGGCARRLGVCLPEALEDRRLLSATVSFNPETNELSVQGTPGDDVIRVQHTATGAVEVFANGVRTRTNAETDFVYYVTVSGGDGDDRLDAGRYLLGGVTLDGGAGDDVLTGGDGPDRLAGGPGNDHLHGNGGEDTYLFGTAVGGPGGAPEVDVIIERAGVAQNTLDFSALAAGDGVVADLGATGAAEVRHADGSRIVNLAAGGAGAIGAVVGGEGDDVITAHPTTGLFISGNGGDDLLTGGDAYFNLIDGGAGNDTITGGTGGTGGDQIDSGPGADLVNGGPGNDFIRSDYGGDTINAGPGDDEVITFGLGVTVNGDDGNDTLRIFGNRYAGGSDPGDSVTNGGAGDDYIDMIYFVAEARHIAIDGGDGNDHIDMSVYNAAHDPMTGVVTGGAGDDALDIYDGSGSEGGAVGSYTLDGGGGNDDVSMEAFGGGPNVLLGGAGHDRLENRGGQSGHLLEGGDGDDIIVSVDTTGQIFGGAGNDTISAGGRGDYIDGGDGDDDILAGIFNDTVFGGAGNDTIVGGRGHDSISGGDGDDLLEGDARNLLPLPTFDGNDILDGGAGNDRLYGNGNNDQLNGGDGDDLLDGGNGNDQLNGGDGSDLLLGRLGDDVLNGDAGDDLLVGDRGNDVVDGGDGNDSRPVRLATDGTDTFTSVENVIPGFFANDFNSGLFVVPAGTTLYGEAGVRSFPIPGDNYLVLTSNQGSRQGSVVLNDLNPGSPITAFDASYLLYQGGQFFGTGGEGSSFTFGTPPGGSFGELGFNTPHSLTVSFNTGAEGETVDVLVNGALVASQPVEDLRSRSLATPMREVAIHFDADGLDVTLDGVAIYTDLDVASFGFVPQAGDQFGLGARTGTITSDYHIIDDLMIQTSVF